MKTIDEQLEDALARTKQLEADATASAALLTEAGHQHERFRQEIAALTKERDSLATSATSEQVANAQQQITALASEKETLALTIGELTEQRDQLSRDLATAQESLKTATATADELAKAKKQAAALSSEVETLKANAKSAERIAAERYGAASPEPLPVTPRGDAEAASLIERFKSITEPAQQTAFWRSLTAEQRNLILNAK